MDKVIDVNLSEVQKQIFEKIAKNETDEFMQLVAQFKGSVNFLDDNGMTPLQHACCKGNLAMVRLLMDMGADVNYSQHGSDYTPLHFAALSGNSEICTLMLDAGINPNAINSVSRTASQMAAFVGNVACVETINNYVPRAQLEYYTQLQGQQTEPYLSPALLDNVHRFVSAVNLHPVRIALNLQALNLLKQLSKLRKMLELMCEKNMKTTTYDINELMAFKFHYLCWIITELMRCEEQCKAQRKDKGSNAATNDIMEAGKHDFVELFIKRVLKENKLGQLDYVEFTIRECVREFPFRECTVFRQVVSQLAAKDAMPALHILHNAINGQRGFMDEISCCSTCGNEKPDKKCSKCKAVQYCDRECQRLHWFVHKKTCARPTSNITASVAGIGGAGVAVAMKKESIDANEIRAEFQKLTAS